MVLETLIGSTVGYLVSSIKKSKGGKQAGDEMSVAIWEWIRPIFLKEVDDKEALKKLEEQPDKEENKQAVAQSLQSYLQQHPEQVAELEILVTKAKAKYPERMGDIYNFGNVGKQVNNPIIKGDLNM